VVDLGAEENEAEMHIESETSESTADNENTNTEDDIETLRQKYFEKFGKAVATGYKNNIEWIKKKLL
jgi:uncharacterized protein with gpF-like domain